jgi:hypothetical protein
MSKFKFKLIEGQYSAEETKEILMSLYSYKVKFINNKVFSDSVRFGKQSEKLKERVTELAKEKNEIVKILEGLATDNFSLDCEINIKV